MENNTLTDLYLKQPRDESVTSFKNEIGFSLVRKYPETSQYNVEPLRIFIKVALLKKDLFYSVNMTQVESEGGKTEYIVQYEEGSTKFTNFFSDSTDPEFLFDEVSGKIKHLKKGKEFTLNEFVDILEKNHLSDCLFWKRKTNWIVNIILKTLFWLTDRHYDKVKTSLDKYEFKKQGKPLLEIEKSIEPFFKYFYISKNFIFSILLISFLGVIFSTFFPCLSVHNFWRNIFGEFTLSNPFVFLFFFLILFTSEKISLKLNGEINNFLMPDENNFFMEKRKENFVEGLHNYLHRNKFDLKV